MCHMPVRKGEDTFKLQASYRFLNWNFVARSSLRLLSMKVIRYLVTNEQRFGFESIAEKFPPLWWFSLRGFWVFIALLTPIIVTSIKRPFNVHCLVLFPWNIYLMQNVCGFVFLPKLLSMTWEFVTPFCMLWST